MARIMLVAPPFSGHLHPMLAMARRLSAEHDVVFVSSESACGTIEAAGLRSEAVLRGEDAAIRAIAEPPYAVRSNPLLLNRQLKANVALMRRFHDELAAICASHRPALLIADFVLPVAGLVAKAHRIPWWTSLPSPSVLEARDGPPAYLGGLAPLAATRGRIRDAAGRAFVRGFKRTLFALYRKQLAWTGLRSPYRADGTEAVYSDECVLALGIREIEFARHWRAPVRFVGPLCYSPGPAHTVAWNGAPGPRVLVTFGTHLRAFKPEMADATREAARALPDIAFDVSHGETEASRDGGPDGEAPVGQRHNGGPADSRAIGNFRQFAYIPYDANVRHYDLVVHHGGTGIANQCLIDGVPALVHPLDFDQFDQAARLVHAGIARRLEHLGALARSVQATLADAELKTACRAYAAIAARYGAAETIAQMVRNRLAS
jgi:UDP:flavonoid glycosyltransferase YjiC (YdhE family)